MHSFTALTDVELRSRIRLCLAWLASQRSSLSLPRTPAGRKLAAAIQRSRWEVMTALMMWSNRHGFPRTDPDTPVDPLLVDALELLMFPADDTLITDALALLQLHQDQIVTCTTCKDGGRCIEAQTADFVVEWAGVPEGLS